MSSAVFQLQETVAWVIFKKDFALFPPGKLRQRLRSGRKLAERSRSQQVICLLEISLEVSKELIKPSGITFSSFLQFEGDRFYNLLSIEAAFKSDAGLI